MKFIGNTSIQPDMPDGYYLEYGIFDDGKNLWITKKEGTQDNLLVCFASSVLVKYDYDEDCNPISEISRKYDELLVYNYNPPQILSMILTTPDEVDESTDRLLFLLDEDEVSIHVLMDMV